MAGAQTMLPIIELREHCAQVSKRPVLVHLPRPCMLEHFRCCVQLLRSFTPACMSTAGVLTPLMAHLQAGRGSRELVSPEPGAGDPRQHWPPTGELNLDMEAPLDYDFRCFFLNRSRVELYRASMLEWRPWFAVASCRYPHPAAEVLISGPCCCMKGEKSCSDQRCRAHDRLLPRPALPSPCSWLGGM